MVLGQKMKNVPILIDRAERGEMVGQQGRAGAGRGNVGLSIRSYLILSHRIREQRPEPLGSLCKTSGKKAKHKTDEELLTYLIRYRNGKKKVESVILALTYGVLVYIPNHLSPRGPRSHEINLSIAWST